MDRRDWMRALGGLGALASTALPAIALPTDPLSTADPARIAASAGEAPSLRGTGDLAVIVLRASGALAIVETTGGRLLGRVDGLGDLSHASVVFSRDALRAYVFGRDGGLSVVNLLSRRIEQRLMQAGNAIGGAISADGRRVAAQNYSPGGVRVFDATSLAPLADIPAWRQPGAIGPQPPGGLPADDPAAQRSRVVGLADVAGDRMAWSLFDADAILLADFSADPAEPRLLRLDGIGRQPYDALVTPDGRHYIAGLFGEDGLALVDLWDERPKVRRILDGYGRGSQPLPVYKMPHLRGWAVAGRHAFLPAIGRHEVLVVDTTTWCEVDRIPVAGQPVFVMARPDGRQIWVNFAVPDYHRVQVIDAPTRRVLRTLEPGRAVLHLEFSPRGEQVWISCRDDDRVLVYDTRTLAECGRLDLPAPSGIFMSARAHRIGL
ncbi:cytochrome D1 domain-containing protein [Pseudaquabacterium rugosum]|uniref:Cytochrome D1 domain-containing protein n=1 Tax=Pseudaquabacterium rugosum TaxID=2984194 RepID=A0ABU9BIN1_9BURK